MDGRRRDVRPSQAPSPLMVADPIVELITGRREVVCGAHVDYSRLFMGSRMILRRPRLVSLTDACARLKEMIARHKNYDQVRPLLRAGRPNLAEC